MSKGKFIDDVLRITNYTTDSLKTSQEKVEILSSKIMKLLTVIKQDIKDKTQEYYNSLGEDIKNIKNNKQLEDDYNTCGAKLRQINEDILKSATDAERNVLTDQQTRLKDEYEDLKDKMKNRPQTSNGNAVFNIDKLKKYTKRVEKIIDQFYSYFNEDKSKINQLEFDVKDQLMKLTNHMLTLRTSSNNNSDEIEESINLERILSATQVKINKINKSLATYNYYISTFNSLILNLQGDILIYRSKINDKKFIHLNLQEHLTKLDELCEVHNNNQTENLLAEYIYSVLKNNIANLPQITIDQPIDPTDLATVFTNPVVKMEVDYNFDVNNHQQETYNGDNDDITKINAGRHIQITEQDWNTNIMTKNLLFRYFEMFASYGKITSVTNDKDKINKNSQFNIHFSNIDDPNTYTLIYTDKNMMTTIFTKLGKDIADSDIIKQLSNGIELYEYTENLTMELLAAYGLILVFERQKQLSDLDTFDVDNDKVLETIKTSILNMILYNNFVKNADSPPNKKLLKRIIRSNTSSNKRMRIS